ncbi:single-stranded DNA-binding protein [Staphylococcus sp. IVB6214]|uniref:single-stranded DNA-binding protein n=1 Tax=Staphylococcus sp. IVB6214 TaxID=2989766 RepID=UPI0021CDF426|nr:single-stranded DNA-binding protein [Staphylococcus sp. IVB6214]UXR83202.1 single-stranded DNA-binding protein [Staphylococcus sp. IVB6214]
MINRVVLTGRLTKDPEMRMTQSGVQIANFTLAVNRTFTNAQGERQADFINCIAFKKTAENVNNYLQKGNLTGVDGRLQSRSYENQEGRRVYVTEVVCDNVQFLEPKNSENTQTSNTYQYNQPPQTNSYQQKQQPIGGNPFGNANGPIDISDDDLPF